MGMSTAVCSHLADLHAVSLIIVLAHYNHDLVDRQPVDCRSD